MTAGIRTISLLMLLFGVYLTVGLLAYEETDFRLPLCEHGPRTWHIIVIPLLIGFGGKLLERANASVKANSRILAQKDVDIAIRFESDPRNTSEGRHNLQFRVSNRSKHNIDSWHARVRVPSAIRPIENAWPVEENDGNGVIVYGITSDHMATGGNNHNGNHHDPKIPAGSARHYPSIGMRPGNEQLNNNAWAGSQEVSLEFYPNNQARAITAKFTIADMLHGFSKG